MPYQPWDEDTSPVTPQEGYCTHDSILFPVSALRSHLLNPCCTMSRMPYREGQGHESLLR